MDFAVATISTKGQLVIPSQMRTSLKAGEQVLIVRDEDRFVLKKMSSVAKEMQEDLMFAKRTDEAYEQHLKSNKRTPMTMGEFLKTAKKW